MRFQGGHAQQEIRDHARAPVFQPSVQEHVGHPPMLHPRTWRLSSLAIVAFLGGPLAAAAMCGLNGIALGLRRTQIVLIGAAGVAGLGILVVVVTAVLDRNAWRLASSLLGVAVYAIALFVQRPADRHHRFRYGDDGYESLLGPGIGAVIGARIAEGIIVSAAVHSL